MNKENSGYLTGNTNPNKDFRVIAIISTYNEGDIISPVIRHLIENGIHVYLIDNHSTDDTVDQASQWVGKGLLNIELFPVCRDNDAESIRYYRWSDLLRRKEQLADELNADWFIHHDADEIRETPWPGCSLRDGIQWVDALGYNCIDFWVLNFPPVDDGFRQGMDPKTYFKFYQDGTWLDYFQRKCWKARSGPVSLATWGGHDVYFDDRRVFPIRFLLRHYPIRGQIHGKRKVFAERKARYLPSERARGWHQQYNSINDENHCFLADQASLKRFDPDHTRLELLLREDGKCGRREILQQVTALHAGAIQLGKIL